MVETLRVVHYLNQFFGGIGAEEHANIPLQVEEGAVGPGRAVQQMLGDQGTVVATFVCGDNYFVEEGERAAIAARQALEHYAPDLVLAGPAFDAGRYGVACAQMCAVAKEAGVPAVTGMYPENPGYTTFRRELVCVPTGTRATEMQAILTRMIELGAKLARGEELGPAAREGLFAHGPQEIRRASTAWLGAGHRHAGDPRERERPYPSEVLLQQYETVPPPPPVKDLGQVTLGLVTSGGLVPRGNPDGQVSGFAQQAFRYSIEGQQALSTEDWESVHGGFNPHILNTKKPSYVLPLPVLRELEAEGEIGAIYPYFFSTVGNGTAVSQAKQMGAQIAEEFKRAQIRAALLVAT